jgi:hypothetical protein
MSKWECAEGFLPFVTARLELRWQRSHVQRARAARYTQGMPRCQFRNSCAIGVPSTPLPLIALFLRTPPPAEATPVALLVRTELLMRTVELARLERIPFWLLLSMVRAAQRVKYRESFRPFAPAVLREDVSDWFELDTDSRYMLLVADVKRERRRRMTNEEEALFGIDKLNVARSDIPAVTHVDYSARVQTVHADTNPRFHALISRFKAKTGCPVLVNTSIIARCIAPTSRYGSGRLASTRSKLSAGSAVCT